MVCTKIIFYMIHDVYNNFIIYLDQLTLASSSSLSWSTCSVQAVMSFCVFWVTVTTIMPVDGASGNMDSKSELDDEQGTHILMNNNHRIATLQKKYIYICTVIITYFNTVTFWDIEQHHHSVPKIRKCHPLVVTFYIEPLQMSSPLLPITSAESHSAL